MLPLPQKSRLINEVTKGSGSDKASFELQHILASNSDDDDIMTTSILANGGSRFTQKLYNIHKYLVPWSKMHVSGPWTSYSQLFTDLPSTDALPPDLSYMMSLSTPTVQSWHRWWCIFLTDWHTHMPLIKEHYGSYRSQTWTSKLLRLKAFRIGFGKYNGRFLPGNHIRKHILYPIHSWWVQAVYSQ